MINYDFIESKDAAAKSKTEPAALTIAKPFDLEKAKDAFFFYEAKINDLANKIDVSEIKTETDAKDFTDTLANARSIVKELEIKRKHITAEAYSFYKDVLGFEKYYADLIGKKIIKPANQKLSFYFKQKEIERQKAEKAAQAAAAKKQAELDAMAEAAGVDKVKLDQPVFKDEKPKIVGESGSASLKENWLYEIIDLDQIPRSYLMLNDKAVKQAIKNGERKIPGLHIFNEYEAKIRIRR